MILFKGEVGPTRRQYTCRGFRSSRSVKMSLASPISAGDIKNRNLIVLGGKVRYSPFNRVKKGGDGRLEVRWT